jgi:hypothetical protein
MKTIESLQRWLKAKGFDPGPTDGIEGPFGIRRVVSPPSVLDLPFCVLLQLQNEFRPEQVLLIFGGASGDHRGETSRSGK